MEFPKIPRLNFKLIPQNDRLNLGATLPLPAPGQEAAAGIDYLDLARQLGGFCSVLGVFGA